MHINTQPLAQAGDIKPRGIPAARRGGRGGGGGAETVRCGLDGTRRDFGKGGPFQCDERAEGEPAAGVVEGRGDLPVGLPGRRGRGEFAQLAACRVGEDVGE